MSPKPSKQADLICVARLTRTSKETCGIRLELAPYGHLGHAGHRRWPHEPVAQQEVNR